MNKNLQKILAAFLVLFSLTAQANPGKGDPEDKITKLLIIALDVIKDNRETLELELSYDFADMDIDHVLSHETTLVNEKALTKDMVLGICKKHGADGVLLIRLIDAERQNEYSYNQRSQYTGGGVYFWGDYSYAYGNFFDAVSSTKVIIETDIYTVPGAKLVFEERRNMKVGDVEEAIGKFASKVSKRVSKERFMKKDKK